MPDTKRALASRANGQKGGRPSLLSDPVLVLVEMERTERDQVKEEARREGKSTNAYIRDKLRLARTAEIL